MYEKERDGVCMRKRDMVCLIERESDGVCLRKRDMVCMIERERWCVR